MGSGIAQVCARAGHDVVASDTSEEATSISKQAGPAGKLVAAFTMTHTIHRFPPGERSDLFTFSTL